MSLLYFHIAVYFKFSICCGKIKLYATYETVQMELDRLKLY